MSLAGNEIAYLTAVELAALYREAKLSPVEVVHSHRDRIERLDAGVNS